METKKKIKKFPIKRLLLPKKSISYKKIFKKSNFRAVSRNDTKRRIEASEGEKQELVHQEMRN